MRPKERVLTIRLLEKMERNRSYASKIGLIGSLQVNVTADETKRKPSEREVLK